MVYVTLADGFEEIEAVTPIDIMRRAGIDVTTVSITSSQYVTGAHNITVKADKCIKDVDKEDMDMLFLPGGAGHELLDASNDVHALINYAVIKKIHIAAICAAPSVIGKKMILSDKKATCFPGYEKYLYGADIVDEQVVADGNCITARGAGAAAEFGFEIVKILKDEKTADELRKTMQYE